MALGRADNVKALMALALTVSAAAGRNNWLRQAGRGAASTTFRANSFGPMVAGFAVSPGVHVSTVISQFEYGVGLMVCRPGFAILS